MSDKKGSMLEFNLANLLSIALVVLLIVLIFNSSIFSSSSSSSSSRVESILYQNYLEVLVGEIYSFNESSDETRSIDVYIPENAAIIYHSPRQSFRLIRPNMPSLRDTLNVNNEEVNLYYNYFGRNAPFPSLCAQSKSCICICANAKGEQIECETKICKEMDIKLKDEYELKEVFGENYLFANASWRGGFLLASKHQDIKRESNDLRGSVGVSYGTATEITYSSFGGIYLLQSQKSTTVELQLKKEDGIISIKWQD